MIDDDKRKSIAKRALLECSAGEDALWAFGNEPQVMLAEISKSLVNTISIVDAYDIDRLIQEAVDDLGLMSRIDGIRIDFLKKRNQIKKYQNVLSCIDEIAVNLRIRQAQLLKDIVILDRIEDQITECSYELGIYIEVGEAYKSRNKREDASLDETVSEQEERYWRRFDRKLNDLKTSSVIVQQSIIQIDIMRKNNQMLADKIATSVSTTIPLWRSQTALLFGVDVYSETNDVQKEVLLSAEMMIKENRKKLSKKVKRIERKTLNEADVERLKELNDGLSVVLQSIEDIGRETRQSNMDMNDIVQNLQQKTISETN